MTPKIDFVTQEKARNDKSKLLFGVQFGIWGIILRLGLYKLNKSERMEEKTVEEAAPPASEAASVESAIVEKTARLEAAMRRLEDGIAMLDAKRAVMAAEALDRTMQGQAVAGVAGKPAEESPEEYATRVMRVTLMVEEPLKVKIGSPEEAFWTDLKTKIEADILNMKRQIEINEHIIVVATEKIVAEKEKV